MCELDLGFTSALNSPPSLTHYKGRTLRRKSSFADNVREEKQRSWCGGVARFLENWMGPEDGFVRYVRFTDRGLVVNYKALDPAVLSRDVIGATHSTIVMSGTLTPVAMFRDLLGFPENTEKETGSLPHSLLNARSAFS